MSTIIAIAIAVVASALGAAFAAADGALLGLDPGDTKLTPHLRSLAERRERPHRALAFARILAHLIAGCAIASALRFWDRSLGVSLAIAIPVALAAVLLSESIARSIGDVTGPRTLDRLGPVLRIVERVLAPVVVVGSWHDNLLQSFIPPAPVEDDREETTEQFRQIVAAEADVTDREETILHGVFSLGDTAVHEVMVPRVNLVGIERTTPWADVLARVRSSEHARFPVFDDTLDEITGICTRRTSCRRPSRTKSQLKGGARSFDRRSSFPRARQSTNSFVTSSRAERTSPWSSTSSAAPPASSRSRTSSRKSSVRFAMNTTLKSRVSNRTATAGSGSLGA